MNVRELTKRRHNLNNFNTISDMTQGNVQAKKFFLIWHLDADIKIIRP